MELSYSILYDRLKAELSLPWRQGPWARQPLDLVLPYAGADTEEVVAAHAARDAAALADLGDRYNPASNATVAGTWLLTVDKDGNIIYYGKDGST